ncbi:MAG: hypothetical protein R2834_08760 [Rhodothermales bacterium]
MRSNRRRVSGIALAAIGLAAWTAGCDSDVSPILGTEQPFTLFGVVSPQLDTQRVLVFPIQDRLQQLSGEALDARFVWTDTETGIESAWQDSIVPQADGTVVHLYWVAGAAAYGRTYDVRVATPAGDAETQVTVNVPPTNVVEIGEPSGISGVIVPVLVRGDLPNLLKIELEYGFDYTQTTVGEKLESLILPYDEQASRTADGWLIQVNLVRDYRTILDYIRSQRSMDLAKGVQLRGIQLRFLVANAEWNPPDGVFDPEVLVQPGTMSNVNNGFGFIGAGYRTVQNWLPADSIANAAGFRQGER